MNAILDEPEDGIHSTTPELLMCLSIFLLFFEFINYKKKRNSK